MTTATDRWTDLCSLDEIPEGGLKPVAVDGHKLVVARPSGGEPAVLDNRCPHEGYPLSQGSLAGDTLTCCWHNWKFRVGSGACLLGGEDVAHWPARVEGDRVLADLTGPDPAQAIPPLKESLLTGVLRHENGRAVRDGLRLLQYGVSPRELLVELAALDGRHGEYGLTHTLAVAADCAKVLDRLSGPRAMEAVAPVIDLCGESIQRLPPRPRASPLPWTDAGALHAAVEAEDTARAQGLLGGYLAAGPSVAELTELFLDLQADHFTDFGHGLIYAVKLGELLQDGDDSGRVADVAFGLLDMLLLATREDTLPYWGRYQRRLEAWAPRLSGWVAAARDDAPFDGPGLRDAVLDGSADEALDALEAALEAGAPVPAVARWLVAAAAHRLLRFHVPLDSDPSVAENWLWVTHRFTFAAAVRIAVERLPGPQALRLLHQTLAFTHSARPLDGPREDWPVAAPGPAVSSDPQAAARNGVTTREVLPVERVLAGLGHRNVLAAVPAAARCLVRDEDARALRQGLEDLCLGDPLVRPIVVGHAIKTTWAAFEERDALAGLPDADVPVLAAVKLLASPVVERRVHELVGTSIDWVIDGKMPKKLTQ
jgi:nitrite reductase/ring-hydroxylating ferredoxin subunit